MGEEIDRMMLLRRLSMIFFAVFLLLVIAAVTILIVMGSGDYGGGNSEFAEIEDYGETVKKSVEFEKSSSLYFFSEIYKDERTLFLDEAPNLKIVNSDRYCLEVKAPKGLVDKLRVEMVNGCLVISFDEGMYNEVKKDNVAYKGLYVSCDMFDVTVYAPVERLYTSAELRLDYEGTKCDTMVIDVIGEIIEGRVYNVDARRLSCRLMGASSLEISGKASEKSHLEVWHNSKIYADELKSLEVTTSVQTQIFGFSYVNGEDFFAFNIADMGVAITVALIILIIASAVLAIFFRVKFTKQRKELDDYIEKVETEGNFLIKPEKNEENILQNGE